MSATRKFLRGLIERGKAALGPAPDEPVSRRVEFGIKRGYRHRAANQFFDDTAHADDEWQKEVYEFAAAEAAPLDARSVVDVGCGSGFKLVKYFAGLHTIGLELEPTLSFLRKAYPGRDWRLSDFSGRVGEPVDIVICADVVEHIPDPDRLMDFLAGIDARLFIISTPERRLVYGWNQSGPPRNTAHCREWTQDEFKEYVGRWLDVVDSRITNRQQATQMIVAHPRSPLDS